MTEEKNNQNDNDKKAQLYIFNIDFVFTEYANIFFSNRVFIVCVYQQKDEIKVGRI